MMRHLMTIGAAFVALSWTPSQATDYLPSDVAAKIRTKCVGEWPDDYEMQLYCIKKQEKSYIELYGSFDPDEDYKPGGMYYEWAPSELAHDALCGPLKPGDLGYDSHHAEMIQKLSREKGIKEQTKKFVAIARKHPENITGICNFRLNFDGSPRPQGAE